MNHDRKFRVALIGLGKMGRNHLRVLREHGGFSVGAVVDPNPDFEKIIPSGITYYRSVTDLLKSPPEIDAIVIASSTNTHFELTNNLIQLRRPMLVEKPLASNSEQASALADLARSTQVPVFVGHTERCNPAVRKLKQIIDSGIIGVPIHLSTTRVGGFPGADERRNTNVLLDLAVHDIDVVTVLAGNMNLRSSICHRTLDAAYPDTAHLLLKGDSGCSASIHVNWITPTKIRSITLTGSLGVARVDYILQTCKVIGGNIIKRKERSEFTFSDVISDYVSSDQIRFGVQKREPLMVQAEEFYSFLVTGKCALAAAEDGAKAVHLAELALTFGQGGVSLNRSA